MSSAPTPARPGGRRAPASILLALLRLLLGWTFLWAALDATFGLGYPTPAGEGWLDGGSPLRALVTGGPAGSDGPLRSLVGEGGSGWDPVYLAALAVVGLAYLLGVALRPAAVLGVLLLALTWLAQRPVGQPETGATDPVAGPPWVYALALLVLAATRSGEVLGLGAPWARRLGSRSRGWLR